MIGENEMLQRGRKSAAAKLVSLPKTSRSPRLKPAAPLSKSEQALFDELVSGNPHLRPTDSPLLAGFVRASTNMLKRGVDVASWERSARVANQLARSLRLTPQSVYDPEKLGRRRY